MKKATIVLVILLSAVTAHALNGSEWLYAGFSPSANGMGYTGAASLSYAGDVFFNPANPAFVRRFTLFGQWGIASPNYLGDFGVSYPFPRGVMTVAFRTLNIEPPDSIQSALSLYGNFSKFVNDRLAFGISVQFVNQADASGGDVGISADIGMILRLNDSAARGAAFGFRNNRLGVTLTGLGKPALLDSDTPVPGLGLRAGFATSILTNKVVQWNWEWDAGIYAVPFTFWTSLGTKFSIAGRLNLSLGAIYGNNGLGGSGIGLIGYTAGASFSFQYEDTPFELFYSYNPYTYGTPTASHFIGAEIAFGALDRTPPVVELKLQNAAGNAVLFSPNYDGANDSVDFRLNVRDVNLITNWILTIVRKDGVVARTFRGTEERSVRLTFTTFFKKLFEKKQGLIIPTELNWNGLTDSGHISSDGEYYAFVTACDEFGNVAVSATNKITLDLTPPVVRLGADTLIFSPNGDGRKDTVTFYNETTSGDSYKAEIRDQDGEVVRDWNWNANVPASVVWDGSDNRGDPAPEGSYDYIVFGADRAGNKSILTIPHIHLSRQAQSVFLTVERDAISPNGDNVADKTAIVPQLSDTNGIAEWYIAIHNEFGGPMLIIKGTNSVPKTLVWDGIDGLGRKVPDGVYSVSMGVEYDNGNKPTSPDYSIRVDTAVPNLETGFKPELFSPDNDGENDLLNLFWKLDDPSGIESWKIEIRDGQGHVFKTFAGTGAPASNITWDGRSDSGELVESATDYPVFVSFADTLGNHIASMNAMTIPVDVLVEKIDRGLKIRINSIEFEFGEAILKGMSYPILNRVAQILKKYATYKVEIQGHTDNVGTVEANQRVSEERAKAVLEYLVRQGVARSRLTARGMGYQYPIASNDTEDGRRRNRRVEFILIREQQ